MYSGFREFDKQMKIIGDIMKNSAHTMDEIRTTLTGMIERLNSSGLPPDDIIRFMRRVDIEIARQVLGHSEEE